MLSYKFIFCLLYLLSWNHSANPVLPRMMVAPGDAIPKGDNIPNPVPFEDVFMRQNRPETKDFL